MTCRAARRRRASPHAAGSGSRASSPERLDRTWPGASTLTTQCRISRKGRARAERTWPARRTWAWWPRTSKWRSRWLRHARANLHSRLPPPGDPPPAPNSRPNEPSSTAPLAGGAYLGPAAAASVFEAIFAQDRSYRLIPTRANRQPAFGVYVRDPATGVFHANGMLVLTLVGDRIRAMTRFDNSVIAKFGFPGGSPEPADLKQHPGRRPLPTGPMQDLALRVADRPPGSRPYVRRSSSAGGIVGRA